jgi:hypothetical protein
VDEHVQLVGDGDAVAGGDERLCLDGFVPVSGEHDRRSQVRGRQDVVDEPSRRAVVRPDPGVVGEVAQRDGGGVGQWVGGGEQQPGRVGEQVDDLDVLRWRGRFELVLEHDGDVQLTRCQSGERGGAVDEFVVDHRVLVVEQLGMPCLQQRGQFGGQVHECGEERPESDGAPAESGVLGELRLGEREPSEHGVRVLGQQPSRLGGMDAGAGAVHELGAGLSFEQRDLAGHRGLGEQQGLRRRRERAVLDDGTQRGQLADIQHNETFDPRCFIPMSSHGS